MFKLVIQDDEGKTTVVPLIRDEITIGRKEGNTIRLTERNVSRRHARILRNNGEVHIEDLGSYNGIRVNNSRIAERVSLRVSDQVQIGDYKLYLKAEGLEQVDDARTMPIERVDDAATDVINAVAPPATAQMPAVSQVSATAPTAQTLITPVPPANLVGSPNRTLVAIADTDPAGRPVATAAAVAALSPPIGHGKLVVLSSNFAGKEFELTRPQMIIGRTDENDLVINHRSISRNHAKLVREHETGRYTISDLQSSNGVRVNGQDYGKVELRRGDVIDLGHVRLRYVEPGEDFVFARDAVITDVPDVDNKRNLWVAVALGVLVLGAVGGFFYWRSTGDEPHPKNNGGGNGTNTMAMIDAAAQVAVVESPDAATAAMVPPPVTIDAAVAVVSGDDSGHKYTTCLQLKQEQNWNLLQTCIDDLKRMGDATRSAELGSTLTRELKAKGSLDNVKKYIIAKNYPKAKAAFFAIEDDSSYHGEAQKAFDPFEQSVITDLQNRVKGPLANHQCAVVNQIYDEAAKLGTAVEAQVKRQKCVEAAVVVDKPPKDPLKDPKNPGLGSNAAPPCDADVLRASGDANALAGLDGQSLTAYERSFACRADSSLVRLMFMESCKSKQLDKVHKYWKLVPTDKKEGLRQICVRNGIMMDQLP